MGKVRRTNESRRTPRLLGESEDTMSQSIRKLYKVIGGPEEGTHDEALVAAISVGTALEKFQKLYPDWSRYSVEEYTEKGFID
jgi:hypothetical protein